MSETTLPSSRLLACALALGSVLIAAPAAAQSSPSLESCGNIDVRANAECEMLFEGGCVAECEPINFELACQAECTGECTASASVDCTATCEADCAAECTVDPGEFNCQGTCTARCSGNCEATCATSDDSNCRAACEGQCDARCDAQCEVTPPEASCEARCEASCEGSCSAQANAECYIDCEGGCVSRLEGGCEAQCQRPEGALFCDGEYVDVGNNLDECVAALRAALDIEVEGYAEGSASCENGVCVAEGEAGCSCSVPGRAGSMSGAAAGAIGVLVLGLFARRRRSA